MSMPGTAKLFLVLGCIAALLAVALGAFGAHGLKARIAPELMPVYKTGVEYHFYHALGMILVGLAAFHLPESAYLRGAGWAMLAGIVLFSGSLYLLSLTACAGWARSPPWEAQPSSPPGRYSRLPSSMPSIIPHGVSVS